MKPPTFFEYVCTKARACMDVCARDQSTCMHVCMCTCAHTHTHTHTQIYNL